jgi:23S rRNA (cytosine1962-C5)-methyltransferase
MLKLGDHYLIQSYTHFWHYFQKTIFDLLAKQLPQKPYFLWWQDRVNHSSKQSPALSWDGEKLLAKKMSFTIQEGNSFMEVHLGEKYDHGIYTDMASIRDKIFTSQFAAKKSILNLFSYTGIFSIRALKMGGSSAISIDLSKKANLQELRNAEINAIDPNLYKIINADIFNGIQLLKNQNALFDIIILDPPSSFTINQKRTSVLEIYGKMLQALIPLTTKGSVIYCFLNHHSTTEKAFQLLIHNELKKTRSQFQVKSLNVLDVDCPTLPYFPEGNYLKGLAIYNHS